MRTAQRDQSGYITFSGVIVDAASGAGIAQPGSIPFTFSRPQAGEYDVKFDNRLVPVAVNSTAFLTGTRTTTPFLLAPGAVNLIRVIPSTGVFESGNSHFMVTVRDMRT